MSAWTTRAALGAALLAAAGCQKNETTARGTAVLDWKWAGAPEAGPRVIKDVTVHARPDHKGAVKIALHVEAAPVVVGGASAAGAHRTAPVAVRATLAQNTDFTIQAACPERPALRLPSLVDGTLVTPEPMLLGCSVRLRYEDPFNDLSYTVSLEVSGDGSVQPSLANGWVALE
jgi:hypothetical protein